jgi:preprotein translocase subunit SecG
MANVLIVAYLLIVLALIGVILIQRSEGGGLGMGSASNGLVSVRGSANLLTRTTAILAILFFATAIGLTILAELDRSTQSILDLASDPVSDGTGQSVPTTVLDALNSLNSDTGGLAVPTQNAPAAPASDPALAVPAAPPDAATETPAAPTN